MRGPPESTANSSKFKAAAIRYTRRSERRWEGEQKGAGRHIFSWLGSSYLVVTAFLVFSSRRAVSFYPNGVSSCLIMNNAWRIMDQKENAATMKEPV